MAISYRDMTFCPYWDECKDGGTCGRASTPEVERKADESGLPICWYAERPECFKEEKNV